MITVVIIQPIKTHFLNNRVFPVNVITIRSDQNKQRHHIYGKEHNFYRHNKYRGQQWDIITQQLTDKQNTIGHN